MYSRRDFLRQSAAVSALATGVVQAGLVLCPPGTAQALQASEFYAVLGDPRYGASVAFAAAARAQGLRAHLLPRGDISRFWLRELQLAWQQAPQAIAGLTGAGPLFCLQQLCGQYGLRVMQQERVTSPDGDELVAWLITPKIS